MAAVQFSHVNLRARRDMLDGLRDFYRAEFRGQRIRLNPTDQLAVGPKGTTSRIFVLGG